MKEGSRFRKGVIRACCEALARLGFDHYRMYDVDLPFDEKFHCWVGLNSGLYDQHVEVSPFVGIHAVHVNKLASLGRQKYDRSVATYAVHLGTLDCARDENAFFFRPEWSDAVLESEARRLAHLYATCGVEFARGIASYEALLPLLEERVPWLGGYPERVAACLYLMGRRERAREFTKTFMASKPGSFERFAHPFLAMLSAELGD
jgi:hypothetical protein